MRIVLDECVPRPIKKELSGHTISTAVELGWSGKRNGVLLDLLKSHHWEVLLTTDQNIEYQQILDPGGPAVVVMIAGKNTLAHLLPLVPEVKQVLDSIGPGELKKVGLSS